MRVILLHQVVLLHKLQTSRLMPGTMVVGDGVCVCVHVLTHKAQAVGANVLVEDGVQSKSLRDGRRGWSVCVCTCLRTWHRWWVQT